MKRQRGLWSHIRSSLWFLPAILTLSSIGLAVLTLWLDRAGHLDLEATSIGWFFSGGSDGARGVLSAIASGIITVTGVLFSITILALQLASNQFTPRVLRNFTADLATQAVLGTFIGTFIYAILISRAVRGSTAEKDAFVPTLSITVAIVLALISVGFLIFFIHHISRLIQASVLIDRAAKETLRRVERLFPTRLGEPASGEENDLSASDLVALEATAQVPIRAKKHGYLQFVDEDLIFTNAKDGELVVSMRQRIGDYVVTGSVLALAGPEALLDDARRDKIRRAFVLGRERTIYQDVEYGITGLVDIALRALSSSIDDPTTASMCLDHLGQIIAELGRREAPLRVRTGKAGKTRFIALGTDFERAVRLSFAQIRVAGARSPEIAVRLLQTLGKVAELVPERRRAPLLDQAELVLQAARASIELAADLAQVEREASKVLRLL